MLDEFYEFVRNYIAKQIAKDEEQIRYSYYELRVNLNLNEEQLNKFLKYSKDILEGRGYNVYFTGARFKFKGADRMVQSNEYMIATKEVMENEFI